MNRLPQRSYRRGLARFRPDEDGATAIEYGLIVALLAIAIIGSVTAMTNGLEGTFTELSDELAE